MILPMVGRAMEFINTWDHPEMVGVNPHVRHERKSGLRFTAGVTQALDHGKLFHINLNGQRGMKYDRELVFGHRYPYNAFSLVDLLEGKGLDGGKAYMGPRHVDYKPSRTEDFTGVWDSATANMCMDLLLKECAKAFRADPEVQAAIEETKHNQLAQTTLGADETVADLMAGTSVDKRLDADSY